MGGGGVCLQHKSCKRVSESRTSLRRNTVADAQIPPCSMAGTYIWMLGIVNGTQSSTGGPAPCPAHPHSAPGQFARFLAAAYLFQVRVTPGFTVSKNPGHNPPLSVIIDFLAGGSSLDAGNLTRGRIGDIDGHQLATRQPESWMP